MEFRQIHLKMLAPSLSMMADSKIPTESVEKNMQYIYFSLLYYMYRAPTSGRSIIMIFDALEIGNQCRNDGKCIEQHAFYTHTHKYYKISRCIRSAFLVGWLEIDRNFGRRQCGVAN